MFSPRTGQSSSLSPPGGQRKAFRWGKHSWHLRCRPNEHLLVPSHDPTSLRYVRFTSTPAVRHMKRFPDALPDAVTLELPEDIVNRRARRKQAARRMPPRTARAQEVENRVHRRAHVGLARPPAGFRRRNQRLQTLPLRITQIAGKGVPDCLWSPYALASNPKSKPPSHLGGGKSRAAYTRATNFWSGFRLKAKGLARWRNAPFSFHPSEMSSPDI